MTRWREPRSMSGRALTSCVRNGMVAALLAVGLAGCSDQEPQGERESVGEIDEALNGTLSGGGFLVKHNYTAAFDETGRENDTNRYQLDTGPGADGVIGPSGDSFLDLNPFLSDFRRNFAFDGNEVTAVYYNRGDLGLGREMHCVDRSGSDGQIACYVTNFAAGDAGSEFTFGLSREIAFRNQQAQKAVATVAMVFRKKAAANAEQMVFTVWDGSGRYTHAAPLDRHALNFATAFAQGGTPDPSVFGTPGVNFNAHFPTNCQNCHGGSYAGSTGSTHRMVAGSYFLPFDLDQFEYSDVPGQSRAEQEVAFRKLNQMVRNVAIGVAGARNVLTDQIDGWYGNTSHGATLSGTFNSGYVPPGWQGSQLDTDIYRSVVRPSCRNCHITSSISFTDAGTFLALSPLVASDIKNNVMPHALQTQRLFWQSQQRPLLEAYLRSNGKAADADTLLSAGPGTIVTLDPPLLLSALF